MTLYLIEEDGPQHAGGCSQLALRRGAGEVFEGLSARVRTGEHGVFFGFKQLEYFGQVIPALFVVGLERVAADEGGVGFVGLAHPFAVIANPYE